MPESGAEGTLVEYDQWHPIEHIHESLRCPGVGVPTQPPDDRVSARTAKPWGFALLAETLFTAVRKRCGKKHAKNRGSVLKRKSKEEERKSGIRCAIGFGNLFVLPSYLFFCLAFALLSSARIDVQSLSGKKHAKNRGRVRKKEQRRRTKVGDAVRNRIRQSLRSSILSLFLSCVCVVVECPDRGSESVREEATPKQRKSLKERAKKKNESRG